jgi:segregation and condensation protein A
MEQIHGAIKKYGRLKLSDLFDADMHKSKMIGIFLSVLELIRHYGVQCNQDELFGEMWLLPSKNLNHDLDFKPVDAYEHSQPDEISDQ